MGHQQLKVFAVTCLWLLFLSFAGAETADEQPQASESEQPHTPTDEAEFRQGGIGQQLTSYPVSQLYGSGGAGGYQMMGTGAGGMLRQLYRPSASTVGLTDKVRNWVKSFLNRRQYVKPFYNPASAAYYGYGSADELGSGKPIFVNGASYKPVAVPLRQIHKYFKPYFGASPTSQLTPEASAAAQFLGAAPPRGNGALAGFGAQSASDGALYTSESAGAGLFSANGANSPFGSTNSLFGSANGGSLYSATNGGSLFTGSSSNGGSVFSGGSPNGGSVFSGGSPNGGSVFSGGSPNGGSLFSAGSSNAGSLYSTGNGGPLFSAGSSSYGSANGGSNGASPFGASIGGSSLYSSDGASSGSFFGSSGTNGGYYGADSSGVGFFGSSAGTGEQQSAFGSDGSSPGFYSSSSGNGGHAFFPGNGGGARNSEVYSQSAPQEPSLSFSAPHDSATGGNQFAAESSYSATFQRPAQPQHGFDRSGFQPVSFAGQDSSSSQSYSSKSGDAAAASSSSSLYVPEKSS